MVTPFHGILHLLHLQGMDIWFLSEKIFLSKNLNFLFHFFDLLPADIEKTFFGFFSIFFF